MRGVGKSFVGKTLAKALLLPCVDLDDFVQNQEKRTITEIVEQNGWDVFRNLEYQALKTVSDQKEKTVIITGGGVPCFERNQEILKKGDIIWVYAKPEIIFSRLQQSKNQEHRPALTNQSEKDEFFSVYAEREPIYQSLSHYIFYSVGNMRLQIQQFQKLYKNKV